MNRIRSQEHEAWARENPILEDGELGRDRTTKRLKVGDGTTRWLDLPYLNDPPLPKAFVNIFGKTGANVWTPGQGATPQFINLDHILKGSLGDRFEATLDGTSSSLRVKKKGLYMCQVLINATVAGDVALVANGGVRAGIAQNRGSSGYYQSSLPTPVPGGLKWRSSVSSAIELTANETIDMVGILEVTGAPTSIVVTSSEIHVFLLNPNIP